MALNDVNVEKLTNLIETLKARPQDAEPFNRWNARVKWLGGFRSAIQAGGHTIRSDEPEELAGTATGPNPAQLLLSATASCLAVGYAANATARGIKIDELEIEAEGELDNILYFLGLSDEGHPGYRDVKFKVYLKSDVPPEALKELHEYTLRTSPICNSVARRVNLTAELVAPQVTEEVSLKVP
jgi:uncharacterized OsmC-like protein